MENKSIWTKNFIIIAIINFTTFFGFNMTVVGMPVYASQLGATDLTAGLITTFITAAALIIRPFSGIMLNRYGRKCILVSSIALMAVSIMAYAVFPILGVILFLRILHGIGWGLASTATSTIAADVIPKNRFAEGIGYFALASALASAAAPALSVALLQNSRVILMIIIAAGCTVLSLILSAFQNYEHIIKTTIKKKMLLSDFFDKRAMLPAFVMFLLSCAFAAVTTFIALHGQARGVDKIYIYFTVNAVVTVITRPVIGRLIDKKGFFIPGILAALGAVISFILISLSMNIVMFSIAGIFAGLAMGTGMGTLQTMAVAAVPPERRSVATSTFLFGLDAGFAVGAIVAGIIAQAAGYAIMYLIMAVFPAIACLVFVILGKSRISGYSVK